jgi:hypothetical protein
MTQRVLMCTMHFARKMRKWIGIPVKWNLGVFFRPIFAPIGGGLKSLSCTRWNARKVYPQLNIKNVNQVWKHQQTITNYGLLCVITCVTLAISKASESSRSFIYGG